MPNVNCLQYATRGNNNTGVPAGTWEQAGWQDYLANPSNQQTSQTWSSLALAVRKLVMTTSGWKVPATTGKNKLPRDLNRDGVALISHLSGKTLIWTKKSGTGIPTNNGVIVMGDFDNNGGVHYFVRVDEEWMGVPGPTDDKPQPVSITGNSTFTQQITGGQKNGKVLGWFVPQ